MNPLFPILLQNIQLIHATFACYPKSERPVMDTDIKDWMERIEMNCKLIYNRLDKGMDSDSLDEFLDRNSELQRFVTCFKSMPQADLIQLLEGMENRYTTGKAVAEDFGQYQDKIVI